jgi:hypothetical protein
MAPAGRREAGWSDVDAAFCLEAALAALDDAGAVVATAAITSMARRKESERSRTGQILIRSFSRDFPHHRIGSFS